MYELDLQGDSEEEEELDCGEDTSWILFEF